MKFDIEAAKTGATIQHKLGGKWQDVYFVGMARTGEAVVQFGNGCVSMKNETELRMKPTLMTLAIELWRDATGLITSRIVYENGGAADTWNMGVKIDTISYRVAEE